MKIGVGLPNTLPGTEGETLLAWARIADRGPFSSVGVFDRLLYDSYEPLVTLGSVAAVTDRVRIATIIVISPLRNTASLAKASKSLHALSGGRMVLGLSVGAREDDYHTAQVPTRRRGQRFDQQLATLRDLWENPRFGPLSAADGQPDLLVGGLSDAAFARVARYADGYVHGGGPPRAFASAARRALTAWEDAGRPGKPQLWGMGYFAFGEEEREKGMRYLRDYYAFTGPFAERIAQGLLSTPQAVAQFIRGYADAGCDELVLFPTSADMAQLERLAEVVAA